MNSWPKPIQYWIWFIDRVMKLPPGLSQWVTLPLTLSKLSTTVCCTELGHLSCWWTCTGEFPSAILAVQWQDKRSSFLAEGLISQGTKGGFNPCDVAWEGENPWDWQDHRGLITIHMSLSGTIVPLNFFKHLLSGITRIGSQGLWGDGLAALTSRPLAPL